MLTMQKITAVTKNATLPLQHLLKKKFLRSCKTLEHYNIQQWAYGICYFACKRSIFYPVISHFKTLNNVTFLQTMIKSSGQLKSK